MVDCSGISATIANFDRLSGLPNAELFTDLSGSGCPSNSHVTFLSSPDLPKNIFETSAQLELV